MSSLTLQSFQNTLKVACSDPRFKLLVTVGAVLGGLVFAFRTYRRIKREQKRKNYPKDTVILHQLPRGIRAPSVSPFALKLETWLRMANVKYQNEFGMGMSSKKLFPWITYNGVDLADSQFSIDYLSKVHGKDLNEKLDSKQRAIARVVMKTMEESARWCGLYHRFLYCENPTKESGLPGIVIKIMRPRVRKYAYNQGYGRHTKEEVYSIGIADLKAVNEIIGTNKFLFGDEPCETDAAIFGLTAQVVNHDRGPLHEYTMNSCPNLLRQYENMKQKYWPDWNENIREKKSN